jgi:hypothetical protein
MRMKHPTNPLLAKWANKTLTDDEYMQLVEGIGALSHDDLVFVLSKPIQDNLREQVREELLVRSVAQSPKDKKLVNAAIWLGIASAISSIVQLLVSLLHH